MRQYAGAALSIPATVTGTPTPTEQWQKFNGSVYVNISDGGTISGAQATTLTISPVSFGDTDTYRLIAANTAGSRTSAPVVVTIITTLPDVTQPGDGAAYQGDAGAGSPNAAAPNPNAALSIDNTFTEYINNGSGSNAAAGLPPFCSGCQGFPPAGILYTNLQAGTTIVRAIRFYTGSGAPPSDPADFTLEGSTDGGASYTTISSRPLSLPTARNSSLSPMDPLTSQMQEILLANTRAFSTYRLTFQHTRNDSSANSLRIGEIELLGTIAPSNYDVFLPVYQVTQSGATGLQATNLANSLGLSPTLLSLSNGLVSFVDPVNFLAVPSTTVTGDPATSNLVAQTSNQFPAIPIVARAIDFTAFTSLTVLAENVALGLTGSALSGSGLTPQSGTPAVEHSVFTASYSNASQVLLSNTLPLDTGVTYQFFDPNGYPLIGPGQQAQITYGATGNVTRLLYAARQLALGPSSVQLMSAIQASNRVAGFFPPGAQIDLQVVYYCPPFWPEPPCLSCPTPPWNPTNIIPWYYCTARQTLTNPGPAGTSHLSFLTKVIPATDDPTFVPSASLSAFGGAQVSANVVVSGGTAPYSFLWGGSDPNVSTNSGASILYTPIVRVGKPGLAISLSGPLVTILWPYPSDGFILEGTPSLAPPLWTPVPGPFQTNADAISVTLPAEPDSQFFRLRFASPSVAVTETVTVTVTDANGVTAEASAAVPAQAVPIEATDDPAIDYGCSSPYDPGIGLNDRAGWLSGMSANPGGGFQRFCWTGRSCSPGDFIEPRVPGVLPAKPYIYGDADYSDRGVNTADLVLYIGHGNPNLISFILYDYGSCGTVNPISLLWEPYFQLLFGAAVRMPSYCNANLSTSPDYYVTNYLGSWRNSGPTPNDTLYWLGLLSCEVLKFHDTAYTGDSAWVRWGPAANGVHLLMGFDSLAGAGTGFPNLFAYNMLHVGTGYPLTIMQAWVHAAKTKRTGYPAVMGPSTSRGVSDYNDYYWGKGTVNPSIPAASISGWWYLGSTY